jgi:cell cycle sensor histidine kinase DivJ
VTVTAEVEADELVIRVADTGIGIGSDDLPHVLQPFVQGAAGQAMKSEGSGLGLPFSKGLAELHGGSLHLESVLDVGTTVAVRFPVQAHSEPKACVSDW